MAMRRGGENGAFLARPRTCFEPFDCVMISPDRLEATRRPGLPSGKMLGGHGGDAAMAMWALRVVAPGYMAAPLRTRVYRTYQERRGGQIRAPPHGA